MGPDDVARGLSEQPARTSIIMALAMQHVSEICVRKRKAQAKPRSAPRVEIPKERSR